MSEKMSPKKTSIDVKKVVIAAAAVIVLVMAVTGAYCSFLVSHYGGSKAIASGITIDGIDVGGMDEKQAENAVLESKEALAANKLELVMDEKITTAEFSEFEIDYHADEAAKKAVDYGKTGSLLKRISECRNIKKGKVNLETEPEVSEESVSDYVSAYFQSIGSTVVENSYRIDGDKLVLQNGKSGQGVDRAALIKDITELLLSGKAGKIGVNLAHIDPMPWDAAAIEKEVCKGPENASYEKRDGKGYIVEAKRGYKFKLSDLEKLIADNKENDKPYSLKIEVIEPTVKTVDESGLFQEVISEYTSSLAGSDANRRKNVEIACASVNGSVLNPGEIFSYNAALGPVTAAAGYREATIFTTKGHEAGIGGGVCQVSSTLYSAALYGNFEIVKRRNHMYIVGYVPYGQDATVYEGELDFRFKNNTNEPIKITAAVSGGTVYIKILGKKPDPSLKVEIENIIVNRSQPQTVVKEDPSLPEGKVTVSEKGTIGLTVDTYKKIFKNGELQSREYLHRSVYKPIDRVEIHGTAKSAETSAEPENAPENTEKPQNEGASNKPQTSDESVSKPATEKPAESGNASTAATAAESHDSYEGI